jgi:adenine-specific DNA-methyltransferase
MNKNFMDGSSLNIIQEQISKLKSLFPEIVSEDKIDWERLRLTLGEDIFISNDRYVLNWAGKTDAFRSMQTNYFNKNNDQLKTNTYLQFKDAGVDFRTVSEEFIE